MKNVLLIISLLVLLGFSGCGYKQGVITGDKKSYLYFTGNTENILVSINDGIQFSVKAGKDNQYKIKPGKHLVKVYKGDKIIVKREIFVGDGIAKEIEVVSQ